MAATYFRGFAISHTSEELSPRRNPSSKGEEYSTPAAPRILIVEDVLLVAWHLESLALELGYEVCGLATDGQDAIEQAADAAANVLLMDVNSRRRDGRHRGRAPHS